MNKKAMCLMPAALIILVGTAQALPLPADLDIDFRDSVWHAADGQTTWMIDDITVLAQPNNAVLYQDT
ncbi:MAG: hypothetical protein IH612_00960, partial [Desulfofustis sp.]|nr:hypothetical protein [Desulfofustis sp.]